MPATLLTIGRIKSGSFVEIRQTAKLRNFSTIVHDLQV